MGSAVCAELVFICCAVDIYGKVLATSLAFKSAAASGLPAFLMNRRPQYLQAAGRRPSRVST